MNTLHRSAITVLFSLSCLVASAQPDVPVDPLTGKAQVFIPIGSVSAGSLSASASLAYDGGGVKMGESEGEAGMGWSLVAGGAITRELRGLPDDFNGLDPDGNPRRGWLHSGNKADINSFSPASNNGCGDWTGFNVLNNSSDTEPDLYHISAPGLSGTFVFDHVSQPRFMPWQDIKVTSTITNNRLVSFEVTNNLGVKYNFATGRVINRTVWSPSGSVPDKFLHEYQLSDNLENVTMSWILTTITSPVGETITFGFGGPANQSFGRSYKRGYNNSGFIDTLFVTDDVITNPLLSSITTATASIGFNWNVENALLSTISVGTLTSSRVFNLVYQVFNDQTESVSGSSAKRAVRSYLSKVVEGPDDCNAFPAFELEYYGPTGIPYLRDWHSDMFGYYNGGADADYAEGSRLNIYENTGASNGARFRVYPATGYTQVKFDGVRIVNPSTVYYGSLKKIKYPSGGTAEITWEPNDYWDEAASANNYGAGVRVAQVKLSDGDGDASNDINRNYSYKLANETSSSGRWLYPPVFGFDAGATNFYSPDNMAPVETMLYERVTVSYPSNGKTVYNYLMPGRYTSWHLHQRRLVGHTDPHRIQSQSQLPFTGDGLWLLYVSISIVDGL